MVPPAPPPLPPSISTGLRDRRCYVPAGFFVARNNAPGCVCAPAQCRLTIDYPLPVGGHNIFILPKSCCLSEELDSFLAISLSLFLSLVAVCLSVSLSVGLRVLLSRPVACSLTRPAPLSLSLYLFPGIDARTRLSRTAVWSRSPTGGTPLSRSAGRRWCWRTTSIWRRPR